MFTQLENYFIFFYYLRVKNIINNKTRKYLFEINLNFKQVLNLKYNVK